MNGRMNGKMLMIRMVLLVFGLGGLYGVSIAVAHEPAEGTIRPVTKKAKDAMDATKRYTIERKQAFEKEARAELDAIQAGITNLQMKTTTASDEARAELEKAINRLESKKEEARKRLEELHQATASAWDRLRADMVGALDDARRSYRNAVSALP